MLFLLFSWEKPPITQFCPFDFFFWLGQNIVLNISDILLNLCVLRWPALVDLLQNYSIYLALTFWMDLRPVAWHYCFKHVENVECETYCLQYQLQHQMIAWKCASIVSSWEGESQSVPKPGWTRSRSSSPTLQVIYDHRSSPTCAITKHCPMYAGL